MKNLLLIFLLGVLYNGETFGQEVEKRNWSIEFGFVKSYINSNLKITNNEEKYKAKLKYNWIFPSLKLARRIDLENGSKSITPFIGFAILGANSGSINKGTFQLDSTTYFLSTNGTEVQLYFGEIGSFINYSIKSFDFQFGLKAQYLLGSDAIVTTDYVPQRVRLFPTPSPDNRELNYSGERLTDFSANVGLRVQYNWKRFLFATEYWQGFTDLSLAESEWFSNDIYEYNFRLMLGYKF